MSLSSLPVFFRRRGEHVHADAGRQFKRDDLERAVTREFCSDFGTQLITRRPGLNAIILKAGTLDDPTQYGACQMAINASDRQAFNCIQEGVPIYEGLPPR